MSTLGTDPQALLMLRNPIITYLKDKCGIPDT